jgi:AMMECR1 domain-containing protein
MAFKVNKLEPATPTPLNSEGAEAQESPLLHDELRITELARNAVEVYVLSGRVIEPPPFPEKSALGTPSACFVSIKTLGHELRGCIGTVEPEHGTLAEEIIANAVKAATRDPRFLPVSGDELPSLR